MSREEHGSPSTLHDDPQAAHSADTDHAGASQDLAIEELEERVNPGWTCYPKRTAGWGC